MAGDFDLAAAPGGTWPSITAPTTEQNAVQSGTINAVTNIINNVVTAVPPGCVQMYGGTSAPSGWLLCDGTAVSRVNYSALFAIVGERFGVGDGNTTFNLPDLRDRFPVGKGSSLATLGSTGGGVGHIHSGPSHLHDVSGTTADHDHTFSGSDSVFISGTGGFTTGSASAGPASGGSGTPTDVTRIGHTHSGSVTVSGSDTVSISGTTSTGSGTLSGNTGYGGTGDTSTATPPYQPYQVFNFIIKT